MKVNNKGVLEERDFWLQWFIPVTLVILVNIIQFFPSWIEYYYSTNIYLAIANFQRIFTGVFFFSLGDVLYGWAAVSIVIWVIKGIKVLAKKKFSLTGFGLGFLALIKRFMWIYIWFNCLWGLNYNRLGIAYQLGLQANRYTKEELVEVTKILVEKVNASRKQMGDSTYQYPTNKEIYGVAFENYAAAEKQFPFLHYRHKSIKSSLYGKLGNYVGFLGYYNPFSGEAQVNTACPKFLLPYVSCHEMAHQLGYASESEASFVGYLADVAGKDPLFHYSAYFDLYTFANRELFIRDSTAARANYTALDTLVKQDLKAYRKYQTSYQNPVEPIIKIFYDQYLKANQQRSGINSYNEVVGWLIAYRKKYGKI